MRVVSGRDERLPRDLRVELCPSGSQYIGHAGHGIGVRRPSLFEFHRHLYVDWVDVRGCEALHRPARMGDVDGTPVSHTRYRQTRELPKRLFVVERAEERGGI